MAGAHGLGVSVYPVCAPTPCVTEVVRKRMKRLELQRIGRAELVSVCTVEEPELKCNLRSWWSAAPHPRYTENCEVKHRGDWSCGRRCACTGSAEQVVDPYPHPLFFVKI